MASNYCNSYSSLAPTCNLKKENLQFLWECLWWSSKIKFFFLILALNTHLLIFYVTKICIKHPCNWRKYGGCLEEKHLCDCLSCELNYLLLPWSIIFIWDNEWWTNHGYSGLDFWQMISEKWAKWTCYFRKNIFQYFLPVVNLSFQEKSEFWKMCIYPWELDSFHVLKGLSIRSGLSILMINKCDYVTLCNELSRSWEDLHTPGNKTFPNDWCMLQNYEWVKYPSKV